MYDEEMIKFWLDELKSTGQSIPEAIEEAKADISNQRLWQKAADTQEQVEMYEANIATLVEYINRLESMMVA